MTTLLITGPTPHLTGFRHWWARHLTGFDPTKHCARGFTGPYARPVKPGMPIGQPVVLGQLTGAPYIYLCGVADPGGQRAWPHNFHLAVKPGTGGEARGRTFNGYEIVITDATALEIPPLPLDFRNLPPAFTTCRNFQFGVHYLEKR